MEEYKDDKHRPQNSLMSLIGSIAASTAKRVCAGTLIGTAVFSLTAYLIHRFLVYPQAAHPFLKWTETIAAFLFYAACGILSGLSLGVLSSLIKSFDDLAGFINQISGRYLSALASKIPGSTSIERFEGMLRGGDAARAAAGDRAGGFSVAGMIYRFVTKITLCVLRGLVFSDLIEHARESGRGEISALEVEGYARRTALGIVAEAVKWKFYIIGIVVIVVSVTILAAPFLLMVLFG